MIRVYIASKLKYAGQFRNYRDQWKESGINVHARWHDQAQFEDSASPEDFHIFWLVDEEDVRNSDALILYGEKDEVLRGALVETGMALALGKLVLLIGEADFGTWQHHPLVVRCGSFEHAKTMLLRRFRVGEPR